ncbi:MAG TPA: GIY-YIG nuclease family protein [bacterium]|nr:GIY-YIG nuclease family protein [bacterium]HQA64084.1 GIY-YIG nuclease family protein [bacterium]
MYYLYILQSAKDGSYYIGYTENIERRLHEHNNYVGRYTSGKRPWVLVYSEGYAEKDTVLKREHQLKKMKSRKYIEDLIRSSR